MEDLLNQNQTIDCNQTLSVEMRQILLIAVGATAFLSTATSTVAIVLLFCQRMYQRFTHRLVLYLLFYADFSSATLFMGITGLFKTFVMSEAYTPFCSASGFLNEYSGFAQLLSQTVLTFHIGCLIVLVEIRCTRPLGHNYLGITTAFEMNSTRKAKCYGRCLELFFALSPLVIPHSFIWVPFINDNYGHAYGLWCWIRRTGDNCKPVPSGIVEEYAIYYGPLLFLTFANACVIITTIVTISWKAYHAHKLGEISTGYQDTMKQVLPILAYPIIFQVLSWFSLADRLYSLLSSESNIPLFVIHSIGSPSWGFFAAVTFAIYFVVWKKHKIQKEKRLRASEGLPILRDEDISSDA